MFGRLRSRRPNRQYLLLQTITVAAFAVVVGVVFASSSNENVSGWSAFSVNRYLIVSASR
jgi:1,4-dihydroxy-2-naphthoate octaprenyltransferase